MCVQNSVFTMTTMKELWCVHTDGIFTMHGDGTKWKVQYHVEMFILVQDRDGNQDPMYS